MKTILLLLTAALGLAEKDLLQRRLHKDYGVAHYDYHYTSLSDSSSDLSSSSGKSGKSGGKSGKSSGKSGKSSSSKSSKSSSKSNKSSHDGHNRHSGDSYDIYDSHAGHYGYYDGDSTGSSTKSGKTEGDAKAAKYNEALALEDGDVYDLGGGDGSRDGEDDIAESSGDVSGDGYGDNLGSGDATDDDSDYDDDETFIDVIGSTDNASENSLSQNEFAGVTGENAAMESMSMSLSGEISNEGVADDSTEVADAQPSNVDDSEKLTGDPFWGTFDTSGSMSMSQDGSISVAEEEGVVNSDELTDSNDSAGGKEEADSESPGTESSGVGESTINGNVEGDKGDSSVGLASTDGDSASVGSDGSVVGGTEETAVDSSSNSNSESAASDGNIVQGNEDTAESSGTEDEESSTAATNGEFTSESNVMSDEENSGESASDGNVVGSTDEDTLGQNAWLTDLLTGKDDDSSMSMMLDLESPTHMPTEHLFSGNEDEDASSMSMMFSMNLVDDSGLTDLIGDEDIDDSMSMVFSMELSLSMKSNDTPGLEQSVIDLSDDNATFDVEDKDGEMDGGEDITPDKDGIASGVDANIGIDDSDSENIVDDDGMSDDGAPDEDSNASTIYDSYLSQDQRTQIIQEKCNMTPLERALSLIRLIGNHVDPQEIISQSAESPPFLAFLWLVYIDDAILCPPPSQAFPADNISMSWETLDRIIQRYTLAILYFSFHGHGWTNCPSERNFVNTTALGECVDSNGDEYVRFLDSSHECAWFGVTCSTNVTEEMNVDEYSPITHLELPSNSLQGYIPKDISLLYTLEVLDLRNNELTGTIPFGAFATMDSLDTLMLSGNRELSGDASRYCETGSSLNDLILFETDCTPLVEELKPAPVQCSCCTSCK